MLLKCLRSGVNEIPDEDPQPLFLLSVVSVIVGYFSKNFYDRRSDSVARCYVFSGVCS